MIGGAVRVRFGGDAATEEVRREIAKRLELVGQTVSERAKQLVDVAYPPASEPGEPPHRRTGMLQDAIGYKVDPKKLTVTIGAHDAKRETFNYGLALELGTRKMRPRPWLRRSLHESMPRIRAIMDRPISKSSLMQRVASKAKQIFSRIFGRG